MQYRISIDPGLEISASEFAAAWNAGQYAGNAPAEVDETTHDTFLSPEITVAVITAAMSIPTAVISTFISEYLKKKFLDKEAPKVSVMTINTPDGKPVIIIKQEMQ
jgi:hypothetical protein